MTTPVSQVRQGTPPETPPSERLLRTSPFALRSGTGADDGSGDGLTLDGWASVFNQSTVIDSWEGKFKERVLPGSMKKTFRESPPRIQFDHGHHPMIGSIPIAKRTLVEEGIDPELAPEGGAHVVARLFDNWLIQPVRDAIEEGEINGMSFRFSVIRERWEDQDGKIIRDRKALAEYMERTWWEDVPDEELWTRSLLEVRVPELGPVVWPAYTGTSVSVRSVTLDLDQVTRDPSARRDLARFVFMADQAAARMSDPDDAEDAPLGTVEAQPPAVEHAAAPPATPPATDRPVGHVGESPAAPSVLHPTTDVAAPETTSETKRDLRRVLSLVREAERTARSDLP